MSTDKNKDSLRITDQFRGKRGMVYELRCKGVRLTLRISARANDEELGEYCVEASSGTTPDEVVLTEWATTRADALFAVGKSWSEQAFTRGLPAFDWDAVTKALVDVRAV